MVRAQLRPRVLLRQFEETREGLGETEETGTGIDLGGLVPDVGGVIELSEESCAKCAVEIACE